MKAVIYARYSSDNQREESIEGQLRECTAYCKKNNITILRTYIDRAMSAKTDHRPDFQRMIKDSAKGLFDVIIVWKLDRFARNRYETGQTTPAPEIFIKYADYFDVSMDYLYCRTDDPRGKLYDYRPQALKEKTEQSREMREFIEMCFDPKAPVNKRLKEALFRIMEEGEQK